MTDVKFSKNILVASKELSKVVKFNKKKKRGQYKYTYIADLSNGYMVRLSQNKPTAKKIRRLTIIRR
jgi:hypothetical protein